ncbi:MAG: hypothetical protein H6Q14_3030 [Bacteroidetes bacterium]|jgi:hypothetical protein|nr:hypothetical protein [Bacteroidota bacterium]
MLKNKKRSESKKMNPDSRNKNQAQYNNKTRALGNL